MTKFQGRLYFIRTYDVVPARLRSGFIILASVGNSAAPVIGNKSRYFASICRTFTPLKKSHT